MAVRDVVPEFFQALRHGHTYDLRRNTYIAFGLLWGTGAPLMWLAFHLQTTEEAINLPHLWEDVIKLGLLYVLIVLPPVFGVMFGAFGTIRRTKQLKVEATIAELDDTVKVRTAALHSTYTQTVFALSKAIEAKDAYTRGHSMRVGLYAERAGKVMGLDPQQLEDLRIASYLHDVGKIKIPGRVLNKPTQLTADEFAIVKLHPIYSDRIVSEVDRFHEVARIIRHHHERYDGAGYPDGLAGEEIPLLSRILAAGDALDAMASDRPYRTGLPLEQCLEELKRCSGLPFDPAKVPSGATGGHAQFDPEVVGALIEGLERWPIEDAESWPPSPEDQLIRDYLDRTDRELAEVGIVGFRTEPPAPRRLPR